MFKYLALAALLSTASGESLRATKQDQGERELIIGGEDANANYEWFVQFGGNKCGGTLFKDNRVLTSASCVTPAAPRVVYVNADTRDGDGYEYEVECAIKHPDFDPANRKNDIAVIFLKQRCASDLVDLASSNDELSDQDVTDGKTFYEIGLGDTSDGSGSFPSKLQEALMNLITDDDCQTQYGDDILQSGNHVCVNFASSQRGYCTGDGGTPLMDDNKNNAKQYGVATPATNLDCNNNNDGSVSGCGDTSKADVYADVAKFRDWIDATASADSSQCNSQVDCLQGWGASRVGQAWNTLRSVFP